MLPVFLSKLASGDFQVYRVVMALSRSNPQLDLTFLTFVWLLSLFPSHWLGPPRFSPLS